jgi:hypothetical protein
MKFQPLLVASLTLTLGVSYPSSLLAQTSRDLLLNDAASEYKLGYEAGQKAGRDEGPSEPTGNSSQAYRDGYKDGYANVTQVKDEFTLNGNGQDLCPDKKEENSDLTPPNLSDAEDAKFDITIGKPPKKCPTKE